MALTTELPSVLGVALPGHPGGPAPAATFDGNVELLLTGLDAAEVPRAHFVGYSLGGRLALGIARLAPERIESLALVGVHPGLPTLDSAARAERVASDQRWAEMLRNEDCAAFFRKWQAQPLFASQATLPEEIRAAQDSIRAAQDQWRLAAAMESAGLGVMPDSTDVLANVKWKTSLVTGAMDSKFTLLAAQLTKRFPLVAHHIVDDVGHNVVLEAPRQLAELLVAHVQASETHSPCPRQK